VNGFPSRIRVNEEGPREGFQIEKAAISTASKIELIDALSRTGVQQIQVCSFVNPTNVPGMADAEQVVAGFERVPGVRYTALWLNEKGLQRALATRRLDMQGSIALTASATFLKRNQNRTMEENVAAQHQIVAMYQAHGIPVERGSIMAAFGSNFDGDISIPRIVALVGQILEIAEAHGVRIALLNLADTMAWATPATIQRVVGAVRDQHPELPLALHLHDTRGMGIANAYAALQLGVDVFDASVAGLGGCPFAAHSGAAGNVCTEDLVFMCEEMGIETGVDLQAMIEVARLAERIVGHPLPGSVMKGGGLRALRDRLRVAA
jgi:hydroxymethylglutaryl-CoA lyase